MKRFVLPVALVILWMAPRLDSTAYNCVLTNKCTPLPCEFMWELKAERAVLRALARTSASRSSASQNAFNRFASAFKQQLKKIGRKYTGCESYASPRPLGIVGPAPECVIGVPRELGGNDQPTSLAEELAASSTCSELVEAEYEGARVEEAFCQIFGQKVVSIEMLRMRMLAKQKAKVDSLEKSLLRYLSSCAPDANTSRHIAEAGLDALKRAGQQAREKWIASRASAAAAKGVR